MRKLTGDVLIELGFEKVVVPSYESGDKAFVYYSMPLGDDTYSDSLISDSYDLEDDESTDDSGYEYKVDLFNTENLGVCYTDDEVRLLYKCLKREDLK